MFHLGTTFSRRYGRRYKRKIVPTKFSRFFKLNIEFPVKIMNISKFVKQNSTISINVFQLDEKNKTIVGPLYHTKEKKENHNFFLQNNKRNGSGHFCLIMDLAKLVQKQVTKN